ncbi:MAG: phenylacetate-CoA oxygenase subunit PaaJ [Gemmatimonadaceae bacterium]|nr:phenylacetate-CoA oxygenase subunit PaaJ [Gemmatimonadaceae bacterium]
MVSAVRAPEIWWNAVAGVLDPEVPVLSVVDLGIVRDVREDGDTVVVDVTPTYSGCPAMRVIERDIVQALQAAGAGAVRVNTVFTPAWTTDWISEDARERLRAYGIAPPSGRAPVAAELVPLLHRTPAVACPQCRSERTEQRSEFGSTACKAIWYCTDCRQPFEYLKAI